MYSINKQLKQLNKLSKNQNKLMIMKRILLSCLTLLFALTFANAQKIEPNSPISGNAPTGADAPAKTAYLYICKDDVRPIDLGLDVLGVHTDPNKGQWKDSYPGNLAASGKYDAESNVFKTIDAGVGVYVFDFISLSDQYCGFDIGQYMRVYIVILPNFASEELTEVALCAHPTASTLTSKNPSDYIPAYLKTLLAQAGLTPSVKGAPAVNTFDQVIVNPNTYTAKQQPYKYEATFEITGWQANNAHTDLTYTCSKEFKVVLAVTAVEELVASPTIAASANLCVTDLASKTAVDPWKLFNRKKLAGDSYTFNSSTISQGSTFDLSALTVGGSPYSFTYNYKNCAGVSQTAIVDVLTIDAKDSKNIQTPVNYVMCKPNEPLDMPGLSYLFDKGKTTGANLSGLTVHWEYKGVDGSMSSGYADPSFDNATIVSAVYKNKLATNQPYHYEYYVDASEVDCYAGSTGLLIIKAKEGSNANDGRIQVCQGTPTDVYVNNLLGLEGSPTWGPDPAPTGYPLYDGTGKVIKVLGDTKPSTYKYTFASAADDCGASSGVFYVKVTPNVLVPKTITETYCTETLPETVDLNYILGAYVGGTWTVTTPGTLAAKYFTPATGVFNIALFVRENPSVTQLVFNFDGTGTCLSNTPVTVTINLTDTI